MNPLFHRAAALARRGAVLAAVLIAAGAATRLSAAEGAKPNVLFIAVDDLRPELACYGAKWIKSPHIDRLAASGVRFTRAYCQQAVCSPSRTSLMTGLRPDSTKVYDLETHFRKTTPKVVTLSQHFKQHGYVSLGMGKIYHGGLNDELSWSEPWRRPKSVGYALPENQKLVARKRKAAREKGLTGKQLSRASRGPAYESADVPDNTYHDGAVVDMAIKTLRRVKEKPFFLAVGLLKPHLPFNAPKKYWDMYKASEIDLAPNPFAPKNAPPYALTSFGELRVYEGTPKSGMVSDDLARKLKHGYYACVSYIDAQIGRLLNELEPLGLADNTIVVLWGDHGWKLGEHGSWCKHTNFELDTRVVLMIRDPRAKSTAGEASSALVEFVDIYPTLCELAGLPLPKHLEGTSMGPLLEKPDRAWKVAAFSQYPRSHNRQRLMGYSMRTDRYRYTEWQNRATGKMVARELYDHQRDPAENRNVAEAPEHAELVKKLSAQLKAGWKAARPKAN